MSSNVAGKAELRVKYGANACTLRADARRFIICGQIGLRSDGSLERGLKAQLERAFANLIANCEAAGFRKDQVVKITTMVTEPGRFQMFREVRDAALAGHQCLTVYFQVAGLSAPALLCEIEAEAIKD